MIGLQSVDIAILQGFVFSGKEKLPSGSFKLGDLFTVFPRPMNIISIQLTGAEIIKSLTLGCKNMPAESGALHHVSENLKYNIVIP